MTRARLPVALLLVALCGAPSARGATGQAVPRGVAWRVIDLASSRTLDESLPAIIDRPSAPGSVMKLATVIAALESGLVTPATRIACPGYAEIDGRRVACLHPRVRRPLTAAEALSYSCNHFFATIGGRLPRERLNATLAALGLPAAPAGAAMASAATGLQATPVAPAVLLRALQRIVADPPLVVLRPVTRSVVLEGLRGAALFGTAAAFSARGLDALAKTGTADGVGGGQQGLVVAAWPAARPTRAAVVVVAGGAGSDAAQVAASLARDGRPPTTSPTSVPAEAVPAPTAAAAEAIAIRVGQAQAAGGYGIRSLALEDYVARVLAGEAAQRSAPAALEALAITVRTFALANRGRHARDGFDLCDLTHCQVLRESTAATRAAAAATAGLVLAWRGAPASVYYTASCGGRTERPSNVWPGADDPPFLPSRPDTGCGGQPRWVSEITAWDLLRALRAAGYEGASIRDLRVVARSDGGRVTMLEVKGLTPGQVSGQALRMAVGRVLGWQLLKSTAFELTRSGPGYRFTGRGFGHGVGFCVIGSANRAAAGASRGDLIAAYFPGLTITPVGKLKTTTGVPAPTARTPAVPIDSGEAAEEDDVAPPTPAGPGTAPVPVTEAPPAGASSILPARGVVVRLPEEDERAREWIESLVTRALQAAASRSGRAVPPALEIVFHPTPESFTRATREPWWSAALTRGSLIDLQPVTALRQRSLLERTLAHEIAHVVTAPSLEGRPEWVKEGAAMFAAGEITEAEIASHGRAKPIGGCPSDPELRRSVSAAAAREAYGRAADCFARALAQGKRWDDVR